MTTGRRCPNATLPGSHYCGLPAHQALTRFASSSLFAVQGLDDAEIAILTAPDADAEQVAQIVTKGEAHLAEAQAALQAQADADAEAEADGEADADADAGAAADGDQVAAEDGAVPGPAGVVADSGDAGSEGGADEGAGEPAA